MKRARQKSSLQEGFGLPLAMALMVVGSISALTVSKALKSSAEVGARTESVIELDSIRAIVEQSMNCAVTFTRNVGAGIDTSLCNGGYVTVRSHNGRVLVSSNGTAYGKWFLRARCDLANGLDIRAVRPRPGAGNFRDFGAPSSAFVKDEVNNNLHYDWSRKIATLLSDEPIASKPPTNCKHILSQPTTQAAMCQPGEYAKGVNFAMQTLSCVSHSTGQVREVSVESNVQYGQQNRSDEYLERRGSSPSECALKRQMECPDGYYQFGYEALMEEVPASENCRVLCKSLY